MKRNILAIFFLLAASVNTVWADVVSGDWSCNSYVLNVNYTYNRSSHDLSSILNVSSTYDVSNCTALNVTVSSGNSSEIDAGSYSVTLSNACTGEGGGHIGVCEFTWSIAQCDISDNNTSVNKTGSTTYNTGSTPLTFSLTNNTLASNQTLASGTEYTTSSYSTAVGSHTVTFTGVGNFTGTKTYNYEIAAKDISSSDISVVFKSATYTGQAITPVFTITDNGQTSRELTTDDYDCVLTTYTDAGTYSITFTGKGNYTGTRTEDFTISQRNVNELSITTAKAYAAEFTATADQLKSWIVAQGIKYGDFPIAASDYTLTVVEGPYHDAKTYTAAVTLTAVDGKNLTGSITKDFIISNGKDITKNSYLVFNAGTYTYTGALLAPSSTYTKVYYNGSSEPLSAENYDFAIIGDVSRFKDAGTYDNAIMITGKGEYFGTIYASYTILQRPLSDCTISAQSISYNGTSQAAAGNVTVEFGSITIDASEYTVSPANLTEAGTYTLTITAKDNKNVIGSSTCQIYVTKNFGNYANDFSISPNPIPTQIWTGSAIEPAITVTDKDHVLTKTTDYTIAYTNNTDEGQATITITGAGAFSGTITKNFYIIKSSFTEGYYTYSHSSEGEDVTIHSTSAEGYLTPPATVTHAGAPLNVVGIEAGAFDSGDILGVKLPSSITSIANGAFTANCKNLHFVDASSLTAFTPAGLDRTSGANSPFANVPKQALVYLNGATATGENYVYHIGGGNYRCDVFKIYDDNNGIQQGFDDATAAKWGMMIPIGFRANTVTNTRQLLATNASGKQQGYTTCLPYALPIPSSFKAYTLAYSKDAQVGFTEVTGTLAALTPYVLIPSSNGTPLSATDAVISQTSTDITYTALTPVLSSADGIQSQYQMIGTMQYISGTSDIYIMQSGNVWQQCDPSANEYPKSCVLPMRAYISLYTPAPAPPVVYSTFTGADGATTTVSNLQLDADDNLDGQTVYDLQGRRVSQPTKGLYIVNGKKRIIK